MGTHLVDYFYEEAEVEEYCMQHNYKRKYKYVTPQLSRRGRKGN
jgi:hypothetical protein